MPSTRYGERDIANKIEIIQEIKIQKIIQKFQKNKSKINFIVIKAISDSHSLEKVCWLAGWCIKSQSDLMLRTRITSEYVYMRPCIG